MLVLLGISVLFVIPVVVHYRRDGQEGASLPLLRLLGWLTLFAFLSGFSIGWLLSVINVFAAVAFLVFSSQQRSGLGFLTVVNLLLALALRGYWPPAHALLKLGLAVALIIGLWRLFAARGKEKPAEDTQIGLQVSGLSLLLGFLLADGVAGLGLLALAVVASGWFYWRGHYRGYFALLGLIGIWGLYLIVRQMTMGVCGVVAIGVGLWKM
ncbi:MAG: hypothetical protein KJZ53_07970 [Anaerolineales bacterium]|nr:hypothetical protein [Anaerolineales bacterium]